MYRSDFITPCKQRTLLAKVDNVSTPALHYRMGKGCDEIRPVQMVYILIILFIHIIGLSQ